MREDAYGIAALVAAAQVEVAVAVDPVDYDYDVGNIQKEIQATGAFSIDPHELHVCSKDHLEILRPEDPFHYYCGCP
jgi:hypothetical protein